MKHLKFLPVIFILALLVAGCREGRFVDKTSPSFVDKESPPGIDSGIQKIPTGPINQTDSAFKAPPGNYSANSTISLAEKQAYVGKNVAKVWVWNSLGSQAMLLSDSTIVQLPKMGVSVSANVTSDGQVMIVLNKKTATLMKKQEIAIGMNWVYVSDVFVNQAK